MSNESSTKPVVDAVNDAVSALTDLVRSLRATAKAAKKSSKDAKTAQKKGGKAKDLKTRFERAWEVFAHGKPDAANGSSEGGGAASRTRPARRTARAGSRGRSGRGARARASTSDQAQKA